MNNTLKLASIGFFLLSTLLTGQGLTKTDKAMLSDKDIINGFTNPPEGYGEVPFYWWQGDTLTKERISWQLDQLSGKGISSLQINYSHRDFGGLSYGLSNPSKPPLFSDAWWDLFRWFAGEAKKHGMTVSLSDYTIGVGQGYAMDEAIRDIPQLNGSILQSKKYYLSGKCSIELPADLLSLNSYRLNPDSSAVMASRKDFIPEVRNGKLVCNLGRAKWMIIALYSEKVVPSFDPMNPESGKAYNKYFFSRFEEALPDKGAGMLNFFFSDELNFRLSGNLWNSLFAAEFMKRKGYDLIPHLDALFIDGDPTAPKIRIDYNDVIVSLSEENFFEPVYQWHQDRGLTFGCDHGGRGRDVTEFGDYFRTQKWNQGPGSDQPMLSKDIVKAKVASSIAHLYKRPRVWLEGFHSSGWGTSSADVTDAIFANFVAGYNLLSFHGLYYSTMGGWWEWAPPDNHFRMPYWNQIDPLMNSVKRLSFLLSHGVHNCDVAIIYPTEPVVVGMDGDKAVRYAFEAGEELYTKGIDFDFIDYESIARSQIINGELTVSDEKYKVLVVPSMKAIRYASLEKIKEFVKTGGIVVNIGDLPAANDRTGINDPATDTAIQTLFRENKNILRTNHPAEVSTLIAGKYKPGVEIISQISERPYITHRIEGSRNIFFLYNLPQGTRCFFRAKGQVRLWDPWNGKISDLSAYASEKEDGTEISLPLDRKEIQIIVFENDPATAFEKLPMKELIREEDLGNMWEFRLKPSLNNIWGDFELPATNELLGASVSQLYLLGDNGFSGGAIHVDKSAGKISCGFGPKFVKYGPLPQMPSESQLAGFASGEANLKPEDYAFSWQKGVEGDYGHQGYHGLKGEMYDNFIRLGSLEDEKMSLKRSPEPGGNFYVLVTTVIAPRDGQFDLLTGDIRPVKLLINNTDTNQQVKTVNLKKGSNQVLMVYDKACETYLVFRDKSVPEPARQAVSMKWYKDSGVLPFGYPGAVQNSGLFVFESAPGLKGLALDAYGKVTAWIGGKEAKVIPMNGEPDGLMSYAIEAGNTGKGSSQVVIRIEYKPGYYGGGAIPAGIREICSTGETELGDWSEIDGLRSYSGGAWYRKSISLSDEDLKNDLEIDLGELVSSAELFINGKSAGIKPAPPYRFNITDLAQAGTNEIEVLVYNTLSNHYTTIPTRYRGEIKSGLIGPVKLKISRVTTR